MTSSHGATMPDPQNDVPLAFTVWGSLGAAALCLQLTLTE
jgi:hypothetical protein